MPDILFIKTSSLGDVVHQMPAVTDARHQYPHAHIAWVVEEAFASLVALHPAIDRVIPVAARRWRRQLARVETWRQARVFAATLRDRPYDLIVDTQGLMRAGILARIARGERHGYDWASIREPLATLGYDIRHRVDRGLHAIARNRLLTGLALGYVPEGPPMFGLEGLREARPAEKPAAVLLHATARAEKQWPVENWQALAKELAGRGFEIVIPSGSAIERVRSERIAAGLTDVHPLDRQPLDAVARKMADAGAGGRGRHRSAASRGGAGRAVDRPVRRRQRSASHRPDRQWADRGAGGGRARRRACRRFSQLSKSLHRSWLRPAASGHLPALCGWPQAPARGRCRACSGGAQAGRPACGRGGTAGRSRPRPRPPAD